jgi:hypothetical protein
MVFAAGVQLPLSERAALNALKMATAKFVETLDNI